MCNWDIGIEFRDEAEKEGKLEGLDKSRGIMLQVKDIEVIKALRREKAKRILTRLPAVGESLHIIQNGKFDFFDYIPIVIDLMGKADEGYFSTWTMNRENTQELFDIYDSEKLGKINIITGIYFKKRESAVYAMLMEYIIARKQRYITCKNHAKVTILCHKMKNQYITIEGSANMTANPRIEQSVITNSKQLYEFHREWMEELYAKKS
jgi:hypothetical protein